MNGEDGELLAFDSDGNIIRIGDQVVSKEGGTVYELIDIRYDDFLKDYVVKLNGDYGDLTISQNSLNKSKWMKYAKESLQKSVRESSEKIKKCIDFLDEYEENPKLEEFHILHMYPKENAYPDGYHDSKFFDLVIFNYNTMEKRTLKHHDGLIFTNDVYLDIARIFVDGSTLLRFKNKVKLSGIFQDISIEACKK